MSPAVDHPKFRHNAFVHESDNDYVDRSVAFLQEGLEAGEAAIAAANRSRLAQLREALGPDANRVTLMDAASVYTRPARTIAASGGALAQHLVAADSVRVVAEVQFGPTSAEWDQWEAYEAIVNRAFSHLPVWAICTYDANSLPDRVIETAWRTHPEVITDGWQTSPHFEDPVATVRALTAEPQPLPGLRSIDPGADLLSFRERLARELVAERIPEVRALEIILAADELASNASLHGGGLASVRLGRVDGRLVCELTDRGPGFDDPLAGYIPPRPEQDASRGVWIARQLASRVEFLHSPDGHTARLWL